MLTLTFEGENLFCIARGDEEWFMSPGKRRHPKSGVCGDDTVFFFDEDGRLDIYSFAQKRLIHRVKIGQSINYDGKPDSSFYDSVLFDAARDRIIIVQNDSARRCRMITTVNASTGTVIARQDNLPAGWRHPVCMGDDGRLTLPISGRFEGQNPGKKITQADGNWRITGEAKIGLMRVDAINGITDIDMKPFDWKSGDFHSPSPDGRYWLKMDPSCLPVKQVKVARPKAGIFGKKFEEQPVFGLSIQIWEAFPLRYVRSVTVAWLFADELSPRLGKVELYADAFKRLANLIESTPADPLRVINQDRVDEEFSDVAAQIKDRTYPNPMQDFLEFCKRLGATNSNRIKWSDPDYFWVETDYSVSGVDIAGEATPRLYMQSALKNSDLPPRFNNLESRIYEPAAGKALNVREYAKAYGYTLEGREHSSDRPFKMLRGAGLKQFAFAAPNTEERKARARAVIEQRSTFIMPLPSLSERDCIAAIENLTSKFDQELPLRAHENEIKLIFKHGTKRLNGKKFFAHVQNNCPGAVPALRALIAKYHLCTGKWDYIYTVPCDGIEFLSGAALALGMLDVNSMDVLQLFADRIDTEHQYYFCQEVLPAIIKHHGPVPEVLRLAIWVMLFRNGNSIDAKTVWSDFGVRAALKAMPAAKAHTLFSGVLRSETGAQLDEFAAGDFNGSVGGFLHNPDDAWSTAFFAPYMAEPIGAAQD